MFDFTEFLTKIGVDPCRVKLLRHDLRGVAALRRGGINSFGCFASFQRLRPAPYQDTDIACHFLPGPPLADGSATAIYIGTTKILDRWQWDGQRVPRIYDENIMATEYGRENVQAFDLEWLTSGLEYTERLLLNWGAGTRAWFQWAHKNPKTILELRLHAQEPAFPGFSDFVARISHIPDFPQSWWSALSSVKGIYLLATDQGEQYVGSATGADGFMGRWRSYLANGHGGNVLLRMSGLRDYTVTILEVASPDMSSTDILAREGIWKTKLGARAHGLNAN